MKTKHKIFFENSNNMSMVQSESVDLIITSPPYPMIEMWDELFSKSNNRIQEEIRTGNGKNAYLLIHEELNEVWKECTRVVKKGGIICINIGDATRKINGSFQLFPNHVNITNFFQKNGFISLPFILWRKPTNSPNKFMGSGMLPTNAYVTLEHEYILIFRKGEKIRKIPPKSKERYNSAYFWEERNKWFSDVWMDIRGTSQDINNNNNRELRSRSAAFPLELPYRLINMFSIYEDTVLDPFCGTGTTSLAAIISVRNSIGYELNSQFEEFFEASVKRAIEINNFINKRRFQEHIEFTRQYRKNGKEIKYKANNYNFPVITKQEEDILFYSIKNYNKNENEYNIKYEKFNFTRRPNLIQAQLMP